MKTHGMNLLLLVFCIVAALVLAALLAHLTAGQEGLKWLTYGESIGFDAVQVDLGVVNFSLSLHFTINAAQVVLIAAALLIYRRVAR